MGLFVFSAGTHRATRENSLSESRALMSTSALKRDRGAWERLAASVKPEGRAIISGRQVAALDGGVFDDVSPIDGQVVAQVARCRAEDVDVAVRAARATFEKGPWRRMEPKERKKILRRFADL